MKICWIFGDVLPAMMLVISCFGKVLENTRISKYTRLRGIWNKQGFPFQGVMGHD